MNPATLASCCARKRTLIEECENLLNIDDDLAMIPILGVGLQTVADTVRTLQTLPGGPADCPRHALGW